MPIKKDKDVSEMEEVWYEPGDPRLFVAIRTTWRLAQMILRPHFPPGVYKHRSIEEANGLREAWDQANLEALHARRKGRSTGSE